jgi:AcrR family transcriptional regulator
MSPSRTEQVDRRRAQLLAAAYQVVLDRGLANIRIADVAQATKVSGGLVHYHFATKDALLTEMMRSAARQDIDRLHEIAGGRGSAVERLDRVMREYVPAADGDQSWLLWVDAWGAGLRDESLRAISEELDGMWAAALEDVLRDGARTGEFDCPDPAASAVRLASLLDGLGLRVTLGRKGMSRTRMVEHARQAAARELGLPRSAFPGARRSG